MHDTDIDYLYEEKQYKVSVCLCFAMSPSSRVSKQSSAWNDCFMVHISMRLLLPAPPKKPDESSQHN